MTAFRSLRGSTSDTNAVPLKISARQPAWAVLSLAVIIVYVLAGCALFSRTVEFRGHSTRYYTDVKIPGSNGVFPSGVVFEGGKAPTAMFYHGNDRWLLCFKRTSTSSSDTSERFGIDLSGSSNKDWVLVNEYTGSDEDTLLHDMVPAPQITPVHQSNNSNQLVVTNPSSTSAIRLDRLEWAVSSTSVPLSQLGYHDPAVEGLPWATLVSSATVLSPGEVRNYALPSGTPPLGAIRYARALTDTVGSGVPSQVVYVLPPVPVSEQPVPFVGPVGVAALMALLLGLGRLGHRRESGIVPRPSVQ